MESQEAVFDQYKHLIGAPDANLNTITPRSLMEWAKDQDRKFTCVFCDVEPVDHNGLLICPSCNNYKGVMPDIKLETPEMDELLGCRECHVAQCSFVNRKECPANQLFARISEMHQEQVEKDYLADWNNIHRN